ncbi:MmgE/PrpD family protein [Pseudomonas sp. LP_7_YM]|uniref:MmgE/PrpD family protein n=1 Tax=Pseudomonas sp. LP_7_YM TaxID=2485137 RepID=UPI0010605826|nr:MmgE/PrpD family protein [Pseudomonas sp. LP_7_YM]TDV59720.1 2-methylcitrate dehydratase PrpD [Pseudomonas sp. LP_7_YM]
MTDAQRTLSQFICHSAYRDLPGPLVEKAKRHLLDTLGAALAGANADLTQRCLRALQTCEAPGPSAIWGSAGGLSPRNAALVNGVASHALELDDAGGCDHSGAVVVPAMLAVLPLCDPMPNGQELIHAMVLGYDIARRVLEACGGYSPHNEAGWHSTGTCGVFGAAAACARLLKLDESQTVSALGLAASMSGGLWAFIHDGTDSKKLHAGRPAEGGVLAALLARQGVTGPGQVFEDVWGGFFKTLAGHSAQPQALTEDLGQVWKLARCSIKPYAACRGTHSGIDAIGDLLGQLNVGAEDVESIDINASAFLVGMCSGVDTRTLAAAQMSLPYALAVRCLRGHAGLDAYEEHERRSPRILDFMSRIQMHTNHELAALDEPFVTLHTRDGRQATRQVKTPLGGPLNPVSDAQLLEKFQSLAGRALPATQVGQLADLCLNLEQEQNLQPLLDLLRFT